MKDRATIAIQLTQFKSDSEVDELEAVHSLGSSYDIRKTKVTFDYPAVCKLVPVGVGAMRTELNKMKPNVDTYGDNTKHEYNFNDGFPYNSMIQFALMCPKLAHDSRKKGSPSLEKFGKRSAKAKK